jgi:2-desacetyl-2-hydroxyethyl bacteriochlorophyllide A dehydrogenase
MLTAPRSVEVERVTIDTGSVADDAMVVKTRWSLISPGTEGAIYTAENKQVFKKGAWCAYPFNSGYANLAEVVWCGAGVTDYAVGDLVLSRKKHGLYNVLNPRTEVCVRLASEAAKPEALFARMAAVSITAPLLSNRTLGATVLIYGLGSVGVLASQLYQIGGAQVVGVDPNPVRRELAGRMGVAHTSGPDAADVRGALERAGLGAKVDIVVDAVGHPDIDITSVSFVKKHGEYILLGSPKRSGTADPLEFFQYAHLNFINVKGALESVLPDKAADHELSREKTMAYVASLIHEGRLNVAPLVSHTLPYAAAKQGYDGLVDNQEEYTGVILDWTGAKE